MPEDKEAVISGWMVEMGWMLLEMGWMTDIGLKGSGSPEDCEWAPNKLTDTLRVEGGVDSCFVG